MFEAQQTVIGLNSTRILVGVGVALFGLCCALGGVFWYFWVGLIAVVWTLQFIRDMARTKLIKKFASSTGLTFFGNILPSYFPVHQTSSGLAHSISRVVIGEDVLSFDCRMGRGERSHGRTVVAARGEPTVFGWARFGPDLTTEQAGEWTLVYSSHRVMELEEIGALMSEATHWMSQKV